MASNLVTQRCAVVLIVAIVCIGLASASTRGDAECKDLGFNKPSCSHCQLLFKKTENEKLLDECKSCCEVKEGEVDGDAATAVERYDKATLEYDPYFAGESTPLSEFMSKYAKNYKNLKIVERYRFMPRFVMQRGDGATGEKEYVPLQTWRADMMKDFLDGKLKQ